MTGPQRVDAIVVGAGPAGATAAIALRRFNPGWQVVLVDRAAFPRDKSCGDAVAVHAFDELARLGITGVEGDAAPVDELRLTAPDGSGVVGRSRRPNRIIPRTVFDARLVRHAVDVGAELVRHRVRRLEVGPGSVTVDGRWSAPWLVAADGANSVVRRHLGVPTAEDRHRAVAVRAYAAAEPNQTHQRIDMVAQAWPSYAWSFPLGGGRANIGYGMRLSGMEGHGRQALLDGLHLVAEPPFDDIAIHPLPLSTGRPRPDHGRVLLTGDAAGLINPLTGEGIFYAIASGRMAAIAISRQPSHGAGELYGRMLRRRFGRHFATTSSLARLLDIPEMFPIAIEAVRSPEVYDDLAEIGLGEGAMTPRLARSVLRAAWAGRRDLADGLRRLVRELRSDH